MRRLSLHRRPIVLVVVVATIIVITAALAVVPEAQSAPSSGASAPRGVSATAGLVVTADRCAVGWRSRTAGHVVFRIADRTGDSGEIYLFNPYSG